eukprot:s892_g5.t1
MIAAVAVVAVVIVSKSVEVVVAIAIAAVVAAVAAAVAAVVAAVAAVAAAVVVVVVNLVFLVVVVVVVMIVVAVVSHDEWELLDRPQLAPQLPQPLKERFGAPEEASLRFWVNGEEKVVTSGQFPVTTSLAEYLRYHLGLTGTKIGCGEGGCGACTVLLHAPADTMLLAPNPCMANACLRPLHSMNGWEACAPLAWSCRFMATLRKDLQGCIQGNLCRCTGYRPIHDAIALAATGPAAPGSCEAKAMRETLKVSCDVKAAWEHQFDCANLTDVFHVLSEYSTVPHRLVVGNTSTGVELEASAKEHGQLAAVVKHLKLVAHPQVRDVGSWAGNVMIAKTHPDFPSDICLLLSTLNAKLTLMNAKKKTEMLGQKHTNALGRSTMIMKCVKTFSWRNTHAEVNAGFLFDFKDKDGVEITSARLVVGNIEHKPFVAADTCKALIGKSLDSTTISAAMKTLAIELKAHLQEPSVPEPPFVVVDPQYRLNLAPQLFAKAALRARLARLGPTALSPAELSATEETQRPARTARFVADLPLQPNTLFAVPVLADRVAMLQSGDAQRFQAGTLDIFCLLVACRCLRHRPGVHSFISAADVKEVGASNDLRTVYPGKIFADAEKTEHIGQFVGLVLAESFEAARAGARKITVQNQRLGGAYGGKAMLFAPACGACGVAVLKSNRPVLLQMDRTADFQAFGARAPFDASWELSHEDTGKIVSMKQEICAPGDFEGAFIMETIMEQVARAVSREPVEVQELNMVEGMQKAWQRLKAKVSYEETLKAVKDFNGKNRYRKKGIYCMGSRYQLQPHSFMEKCFVRVYDDGSVLLEHTGLEVGQGMDTKALQACTMGLRKIAADFSMDHIQLRIPKSTQDFSWKGVMGTFSSVTSETVATELSMRICLADAVSAILNACDKLHKDLKADRFFLSNVAVHPDYVAKLQSFCQDLQKFVAPGRTWTEVEIDVLTGETQVNSFDLVYDCGKSLNPAVDIGQIEA